MDDAPESIQWFGKRDKALEVFPFLGSGGMEECPENSCLLRAKLFPPRHLTILVLSWTRYGPSEEVVLEVDVDPKVVRCL